MAETSTKPYMIRALYEWCCDNGYTPYLAVSVDAQTIVPRQHVTGGEIVLNVSPVATSRLSIGNECITFQARFSGVAQELSIPVSNVSAIYARENGHGMAFEVVRVQPEPADDGRADDAGAADVQADAPAPLSTVPGGGTPRDGEGRPARATRGRAKLSDVSARPRGEASDDQPAGQPPGTDEGSAEVIAFKSPSGRRGRRASPAARGERSSEPADADGVPDDGRSPDAPARDGGDTESAGSSNARPGPATDPTPGAPSGAGLPPGDAAGGPADRPGVGSSPQSGVDAGAPVREDGLADRGGLRDTPPAAAQPSDTQSGSPADPSPDGSGGGGRSHLTRIK